MHTTYLKKKHLICPAVSSLFQYLLWLIFNATVIVYEDTIPTIIKMRNTKNDCAQALWCVFPDMQVEWPCPNCNQKTLQIIKKVSSRMTHMIPENSAVKIG